jgi:hypothetical protein
MELAMAHGRPKIAATIIATSSKTLHTSVTMRLSQFALNLDRMPARDDKLSARSTQHACLIYALYTE